ncbi:RNA polymerase sigma factor [Dysosmobacter sp. NSJ-60]|jgi:RNA polymerase sigma factor (sigma-70 family)|uniref:DNA-directed RNA polymerase sigma-70 factor n=1 Tax=Pusillibacter faecalis TaxID=2714358 RepID=A0A810QBE0_9FIRM|nr:RNA polymerase sigma factor [Pusillibacter faecalis]MBC5746725.1 RNA polymerase sigma factor [Dysosmobacter hominis]MBS5657897.1 RNA polymerase sigma factor [Oscillibacter sp.]BCK83512.1 DNA-directed RNA polymerase sigma-70 factor [Pusillibacter faecalis]
MTEQTLRTAMAEYGDTVYRLALCRTQSIPDAEDVYQDVFLALLRQQAEGWEAGRMKAWLIRTTLNRCTDLHRFRLRRPVLPLDEALTCPVDEAAAELWEAVGVLPEKLRTAVHLYYAEGYQAEEIAAMLGVPAATIRTRLRRAREKLKSVLGGMEDAEQPVPEAASRAPRPGGAE